MNYTAKRNHFYPIFIFFTYLSVHPSKFAFSADTLTATQSLSHGQTLLSAGKAFELGFFSPENSPNWYIGIWYKNIPIRTYVWVANRDNPLTNSSGVLKISNRSIVLFNQFEKPLWKSNQTNALNPVLQILDTGNLVLREAEEAKGGKKGEFLWQSFDYPTDTLLPDMKLGWDLGKCLNRYLSSWRRRDDPGTGDFNFKLDFNGFPEIFLWNNDHRFYRSGPWNGLRFSGVPEMKPLDEISFDFEINKKEVFYSFHISSNTLYSRLTVTSSGELQRFTWIPDSQIWNPFWYAPKDQCDHYMECGPYGICDSNASPVCKCMRGFEPKNPQAWNLRDGSGGCVRKTEIECLNDKFLHLKNMKLPESSATFVDRNLGIRECEIMCLRNCSCTAFANSNITNQGSGCVFWVDDLLDMRQYSAGGGQDLFVRLAASDIGDGRNLGSLVIGISVGIGVLLLGFGGFLWKRKRFLSVCKEHKDVSIQQRSQDLMLNEVVISSKRDYSGEKEQDELELPLFDFATISTATDNFSDENKLGQGGFGCVYKAKLVEGQEVAVKRLSKTSGQGVEEFKNEVKLIARLQHRNLVRLLGCCIEIDEKMLIYELMENKSLDSLIFNKDRSSLLNWQRRFNIVCGIARGLLYLHQDSRFRIIHRDMKASNILLDEEWNPKISDFGMARIFGGDQTEAVTMRVVGTYGYMSPEYAMDGNFSAKSDVFSFGVLVLEIVSGNKNRGFYHSNSELNLLGHAWRLWKDGNGLELLDTSVGSSFSASEVLRCIQVGLLCVQERAEDRPTMASVVLMLSSETATMPQPKTPGYCLGRNPFQTDSSSGKQDETFTVNQVTVSMLHKDHPRQITTDHDFDGQEHDDCVNRSSMKVFFSILICFFVLFFFKLSNAVDTLKVNQTLTDNGKTLVSTGGSFELGFFSPWNSSSRYVGIWFKNVPQQTVVWVANRNNPLSDSTGFLTISTTGTILLLGNQSSTPIWSSLSAAAPNNPVLQLLDSGNLVVRNGSKGNYLWQSFDHPCDTLIPGMKLGSDLLTNRSWELTSWKSLQDPSDGDYTYKLDPHGIPETLLYAGSNVVYRSGPWDGVRFGGGVPLGVNAVFSPIFVFNSTFAYYSFVNVDSTTISRFVVNKTSLLEHLMWNQRRNEWVRIAAMQSDKCDIYNRCGPNGFCNANRQLLCRCPTGFIPKVPKDWNDLDPSGGCVRRTPLNCSTNVNIGFRKFSGLKLPNSLQFLVNKTALTSFECEKACQRNCSCMAYAKTEVSGCVAWFGNLLDLREYSEGGQDLYIKMASSDLADSNKDIRRVVIIVVSIVTGVLVVAVIWFAFQKRISNGKIGTNFTGDDNPTEVEEDMDQLPLFDFVSILSATDNFSYANKIGEGGFGAVYKGELPNGSKVAVKRLSKDSGQGVKEFKNEVIFISKLQHRNLVRLLGCCIHGEERMLVYEYLQRRSLDLCLFDQTRGTCLDWQTRFNIIVGIARGLLYLHRDSRLRIVHRDLKANNILLDDEMNPKISDFGLARSFGVDQNEANTNRVVGTYGYMSPEYAIDGFFSVKSDVFSFGVLVLEILSGKKNRGFYHPDHDLNLLGHAWRLWIDERPVELMDSFMEKPVPISDFLKCIHVGLLCVQQRPEDRPIMPSVVLMLDSENAVLPQPKQPGFYTERFPIDTDSSSSWVKPSTPNEVTVTMEQGR
ncbi:uncharacterized protein [Euphorbia lathyris]|uniref:uncharacterized protein n=1 Tax=Euphorbia lathyris TaxID=212925 RepID=UPI0033142E26